MLSPDSAYSPAILWGVLITLVALLVLRAVRKDRTEFQRFKRFSGTADRQRMFRTWLVSSFLMFGGAAAVILLLTWRYVPRLLAEVGTWPIAAWFRGVIASLGGLVPGVAIGVAVALVAGSVLVVYLARTTDEVPMIGDIGALLPRNRVELVYGAGLSIDAGLVEELLFRLAAPTLIFGASGSALAGVLASVVLFAGLHFYQGVLGMLAALLIGSILMLLYLTTGTILVPIVAHALIDLRSLVLIPMVVYRVHAKST
ncbi:MAG: CPBP family intramembrane glutamic endopeptidase [Lacisediminihabitans sp.]